MNDVLKDWLHSLRYTVNIIKANQQGNPRINPATTMELNAATFHDIVTFETKEGFEVFDIPIDINIDFVATVCLPLSLVVGHDRIPKQLEKISRKLGKKSNLYTGFVHLAPRGSKQFEQYAGSR